MDGGTAESGYTFYETGYNTTALTTGLPASGSTFPSQTDPTHPFKMQTYGVGADTLLLNSSNLSGTFNVSTPTAYTGLSFLMSDGGGDSEFLVTLRTVAQITVRFQPLAKASGHVRAEDGFVILTNPLAFARGCDAWLPEARSHFFTPASNVTVNELSVLRQLCRNATVRVVRELAREIYCSHRRASSPATRVFRHSLRTVRFQPRATQPTINESSILKFANGSTETDDGNVSPDWFQPGVVAWNASGRVNSTNGYGAVGSANPDLFQVDVPTVDTTDPIASLTVTYENEGQGSNMAIYGISGAPTAPVPEPASLGLIGLASLGLLRRRSRA